MKKVLLIAIGLLLSLNLSAQKWNISSNTSAFDGAYKAAGIKGIGYEFPYKAPSFRINYFEKDNDWNMYITNAGSAVCDNKKVKIKFNLSDKIHTFYASTNADKDVWFITPDFELINLMKSNSIMHVRLISDCGQNDFKFSLSGSSKAINFVFKKIIPILKIKDKKDKLELKASLTKKDSLNKILAIELIKLDSIKMVKKRFKLTMLNKLDSINASNHLNLQIVLLRYKQANIYTTCDFENISRDYLDREDLYLIISENSCAHKYQDVFQIVSTLQNNKWIDLEEDLFISGTAIEYIFEE